MSVNGFLPLVRSRAEVCSCVIGCRVTGSITISSNPSSPPHRPTIRPCESKAMVAHSRTPYDAVLICRSVPQRPADLVGVGGVGVVVHGVGAVGREQGQLRDPPVRDRTRGRRRPDELRQQLVARRGRDRQAGDRRQGRQPGDRGSGLRGARASAPETTSPSPSERASVRAREALRARRRGTQSQRFRSSSVTSRALRALVLHHHCRAVRLLGAPELPGVPVPPLAGPTVEPHHVALASSSLASPSSATPLALVQEMFLALM